MNDLFLYLFLQFFTRIVNLYKSLSCFWWESATKNIELFNWRPGMSGIAPTVTFSN